MIQSYVTIHPCSTAADARWLDLRRQLWPQADAAEHRAEMAHFAADPAKYGQFLALLPDGTAAGLAEVSLRTDYVNGASGSPVAFLEGIFVVAEQRRRGVARALVAAVMAWAKAKGCAELASDVLLDNVESQAMHHALGFAETERVVFYCMPLA